MLESLKQRGKHTTKTGLSTTFIKLHNYAHPRSKSLRGEVAFWMTMVLIKQDEYFQQIMINRSVRDGN